MKFSDHLSVYLTPEWRKQYINYKALKDVLYEAGDKSFAPEDSDTSTLQRHYASCQERFFQMCDKEIIKVNTFHAEKLAEAQRRFIALEAELDSVLDAQDQNGSSLFHGKRSAHRQYSHRVQHKSLCDLKLAFSELYLSLVLLKNYQNLNYMGFKKIAEKHDKLLCTQRGAEWRMFYVDSSPFYTSTKNDQLIQEVEFLFTNRLEHGDRQKAMKRLRVPPLGADQLTPGWTTFRVGLFCGLIIASSLLIFVTGPSLVVLIKGVYDLEQASKKTGWFPNKHPGLFGCFVTYTEWLEQTSWSHERTIAIWPLLRLYRGGFLIVEFILFLGINNYGWRKAGVNHILIFELDPRDNLSHLQLFEIAGFLGVTWCVSVLSCLYSPLFPVPLQVNPLVFYTFLLLLLLNPTKTFYYKSRVWLIKLMYKVASTPLHKVGFADFWLADQLNSLTPVFVDVWALCCFYIFDVNWRSPHTLTLYPAAVQCTNNSPGLRSFIQCIPTWIRFAQCLRRYWDSSDTFPHLLNAGKYSTVFIMVTFAALFSREKERSWERSGESVYFCGWVITACLGTAFTTVWDLKMDWGLLETKVQDRFLRDEMVYPKKVYYYSAIAGDVILRISWAINIFYSQDRYSQLSEMVTCVLGPLEVFRRLMWNFFRLENEHLNNCGQFRAVRDISIAPVHLDSQIALEHLMDEEDESGRPRRARRSRRRNKVFLRGAKSKAQETRICVEERTGGSPKHKAKETLVSGQQGREKETVR